MQNSHSQKRLKIGFQDQLSLNADQKYCEMPQGEHSAILLTFIKLAFAMKIFILSIDEWLFYRFNYTAIIEVTYLQKGGCVSVIKFSVSKDNIMISKL